MSIKNIIKNINVKKLKYPNTNLTFGQVLEIETRRFADILQKNIDNYYSSYTPSVYARGSSGGNLRKSVSVNDICIFSSNNKTITAEIIINENAIHNSILNKNSANAFWLMNDGWRVKKDVWFKDIHRFGYFEGTNFVEKSVREFNQSNKYGIILNIIRPIVYYYSNTT